MVDIEIKKITKWQLYKILRKHKKWLQTKHCKKVKGEQANLSFTDLQGLDL